jgi:hypothetical protein
MEEEEKKRDEFFEVLRRPVEMENFDKRRVNLL